MNHRHIITPIQTAHGKGFQFAVDKDGSCLCADFRTVIQQVMDTIDLAVQMALNLLALAVPPLVEKADYRVMVGTFERPVAEALPVVLHKVIVVILFLVELSARQRAKRIAVVEIIFCVLFLLNQIFLRRKVQCIDGSFIRKLYNQRLF